MKYILTLDCNSFRFWYTFRDWLINQHALHRCVLRRLPFCTNINIKMRIFPWIDIYNLSTFGVLAKIKQFCKRVSNYYNNTKILRYSILVNLFFW